MSAKALLRDSPGIAVSKEDLVAAWSLLEQVVVSIRKIGSAYATTDSATPQTPLQRQQMLEALEQLFSPELVQNLNAARVRLGGYLPDQEAEAISESLDFWSAKSAAARGG